MAGVFICIAGKNNIAVDVLEYLVKNNCKGYDLGVVCNKTDNGSNSWQKSLRFFSKKFNVTEYNLQDIYEKNNVIFISLEFDQLIKPELFRSARLYNIHFSLLPKYKGMYTSAIPILNGESKTGVTLHEIDRGIDTGNIIAQKEIEIEAYDTSRDLYIKYIKIGTQLVLSYIKNIIEDNIIAYSQDSENSSYYSKNYIDYTNLKIDLRQTANVIQRQIRAFNFREYQLPVIYGKRIIDCQITNIKSNKKSGTILSQDNRGMMLATIDYNILVYIDRLDELLEYCRAGKLDGVMDVCSVKKHINESNELGWTPLMVATYNNNKNVVEYLLLNGADIHAVNNNGTNILMYAKEAYVRNKDIELLRKFIELGISTELTDYRGKTLIDYLDKDGYKLEDILKI